MIMLMLFATFRSDATEMTILVSSPEYRYRVPEPNIIDPLRELCASNSWDENLIFSCYGIAAGFGNVSALVIQYVRYAIQAGATGLVLPRIQARNHENLEPMSVMFDRDWFRKSLNLSCPQITVYDSIIDVPNFRVARIPEQISPPKIHENSNDTYINKHPETFKKDLKRHLGADPHKINLNFRNGAVTGVVPPTIVRLQANVFEYSARSDPDALFASIGRIVGFRKDVYQLAAKAFVALRRTSTDSQKPLNYLGFHLVATDEKKLGIVVPTYKDQRDYAFSIFRKRQPNLMYIASDDDDEEKLKRLKKEALNQGFKAISKTDLLSNAADLDMLSRMSRDQRAMVDFLILRSSTYFVSNVQSSFSYQLAYARHLDISELGQSKCPFPEDTLSHLGQLPEVDLFARGMWPLSDKLYIDERTLQS